MSDIKDKASGDDQGMAQTDRAGYHVDIAKMTGGTYADITEGGTSEVGQMEPVGSMDINPKV